jgi:hypothetical protein
VGSPGGNVCTFRVAHVAHLVEVVKRWSVSRDDLLAGSGITAEMLEDPRGLVPIPQLMGVLERARALTGEPAIGLFIGLHTRATLYGSLGFAIISASTIREAIDVTIRFGPIVTTALSVRLRVDGAQGASFSALRDAELRERAMLLLRAPELSLAQIADRLGYSNVTNFERAFIRWTASTPAAHRKTLVGG